MTVLDVLLVSIVTAALVILAMAMMEKVSRTTQPLFRPLTKSDQHGGAQDNEWNGHSMQFSPPMPVGMRAAGGRGANGQSPPLAGLVQSGPVCWTTGMSRIVCRYSNCLARSKSR